MKNYFLVCLIVFLSPVFVLNAQTTQVAKPKTQTAIIDQDDDVKDYPGYYKKRVLEFRAIIRKEKAKEAKIKTAMKILNDDSSPYRKDALNFLSEVKAKEAIPAIIKIGEEKDYRFDAAWAIGEIGSEKGVEFLIRCLYDSSENVRGNSSLGLKKITGLDFGYIYSDDEVTRNRAAGYWENWWNQNKTTFKAKEMTEDEIKDADEKWQKYGRKYLEKILNQ